MNHYDVFIRERLSEPLKALCSHPSDRKLRAQVARNVLIYKRLLSTHPEMRVNPEIVELVRQADSSV